MASDPTASPADWSRLCHEYDAVLDRMTHANKRLFAWFVFCWSQALIWMVVALWALTK